MITELVYKPSSVYMLQPTKMCWPAVGNTSCLNATLPTQPSKRYSTIPCFQHHKKSELFGCQLLLRCYTGFTKQHTTTKKKHCHKHTHTHTHKFVCSVEIMKHCKYENKYGRLSISTHMLTSNNSVSFIQRIKWHELVSQASMTIHIVTIKYYSTTCNMSTP